MSPAVNVTGVPLIIISRPAVKITGLATVPCTFATRLSVYDSTSPKSCRTVEPGPLCNLMSADAPVSLIWLSEVIDATTSVIGLTLLISSTTCVSVCCGLVTLSPSSNNTVIYLDIKYYRTQR